MFELRESTRRFFPSSASAKKPPRSSTQNASSKRTRSSSASRSSRSASAGSRHTSRASSARPRFASYTYPCTSTAAIGASANEPSWKRCESPESFHDWFARPKSTMRLYSTKPSPSRSP